MGAMQTELREQLESMIASGLDGREAAATIGVSGRTARRWVADIEKRGLDAPTGGALISEGMKLAKSVKGYEGAKKPTKARKLSKAEDVPPPPPVNKNLYRKRGWSRFADPVDRTLEGYRCFVITSCQNDVPVDKRQLAALRQYCKRRKAKLLIIPVSYQAHKASKWHVDPADLFYDNVSLSKHFRLLARVPVLPTIVSPLAGLAPLAKQGSFAIGGPQIARVSFPTRGSAPAEGHVTGSVNVGSGAYSKTKTGIKAAFNHSNAAIVVELGNDESHFVRVLNSDKSGGFFDCCAGGEGYYSAEGFAPLRQRQIAAMVVGDEHVAQADPKFVAATYLNKDSMSNVMRPKVVVHHDFLDFLAGNHHDRGNSLRRYSKWASGVDSVERELINTTKHLIAIKNARKGWTAQDVFAESNHDKALKNWLATADIDRDVPNQKVFFLLNYLMREFLETNPGGGSYPNAFELWIKHSSYAHALKGTRFLNGLESFKVHGNELGMHGHEGTGGKPGSIATFASLPFKIVFGHTHKSGIDKGAYNTGHGSLFPDYLGGANAWIQANCFIYENKTRQLVNIINGNWRGPA